MADEEVNPYELLGLGLEATEAEIRTAYRQRSLKVHPDRNRGNPDAARKFHELNQGYELLLDPLRRMALDAKMRVTAARKTRFASYDAKRKGMVDELEERERALKKARTEKEAQQKATWRANEKIMEEGRILREERERALQRRELEREDAERRARESLRESTELDPPQPGALDTTVRLKYALAAKPELTTAASLSALLARFGAADTDSVVISLKPPPPKKAKRATALVPFKQIGGAFAAVCASGRAESGLDGVEVTWAEGKEPALIGWLKKMGKLGGGGTAGQSALGHDGTAPLPATPRTGGLSATEAPSFASTFPDFPDVPHVPVTPAAGTKVAGLDYESLTLMRLRQAERERLEREIREKEAAED